MRPLYFAVITSMAVSASLSGCAGYSLTPLATDAHDPSKEGYVFYAPAPFLMGTLKSPPAAAGEKTAPASYDFKIVYLPDRSRPYRFTRYECLAKSDLKITFTDGWLFTGAESSTDSTQALTAIVDLAKLAAGAALPGAAPAGVLLWRIDVNGAQVSVVRVTVP
ncbi:MAG: hypothetical protein AABZ53_08710 [Planctomycetota bacterium]